MVMTDEVCGCCKYGYYDAGEGVIYCDNMHADEFTDFVPWNNSCEFWEMRD